jgi:DNA-binding GntR family transcriptional regulator
MLLNDQRRVVPGSRSVTVITTMSGMADHAIDKGSPTPYFDQLAELLRQQIEDGQLKPNSKIPTQFELVEVYDVSRGTASRATEILLNEGLVIWSKGKGLYVADAESVAAWKRARQAARNRRRP